MLILERSFDFLTKIWYNIDIKKPICVHMYKYTYVRNYACTLVQIKAILKGGCFA